MFPCDVTRQNNTFPSKDFKIKLHTKQIRQQRINFIKTKLNVIKFLRDV